ncbi:MAG TPA: arylsulfatase [Sedimentisphaerales bacterium]|nr:arylsulfatase [Sedimentisphaerales bacterium]
MMQRRTFLRTTTLGIVSFVLSQKFCAADTPDRRPNIVYILADDLGYGDVRCLNTQSSKIPTPNLDRLASEGMRFTDAHSGSAVCTPTRYGILAGRYAWRTRLQKSVLFPGDKPLIAKDRMTVPSLLKRHGYTTACIGKWHLGIEWSVEGDYSRPLIDGPTSHGFDYYFGTDVPNFPPYCFIENDRTVGLPTAKKVTKDLDGLPGAMLPGWRFDEILPGITERAVEYIGRRTADGRPFFLYFALTSPHEPIAPSPRFKGKSGISEIADFIMETDWAVGEVIKAIDKNSFRDNTLVIFTSDNGHSSYTDLESLLNHGHKPSAQFRGYKSNIWEGGHRIPFFARWPGRIEPGSQSDQLICLTDLMATCAEIVGAKLSDNAGEDSVSNLSALLGTATEPLREAVVHHSSNGKFSIRQGKWKLSFCPGSGGYGSAPSDDEARKNGLPMLQLYDFSSDICESNNLVAKYPDVVNQLTKLLDKYIADGRSTPGIPQKNDVIIER